MIPLYLAAYTYAFYLFFISTMGILRAWPTLSTPTRVFVSPMALIAVVMDITFNLFISTLLLLDMPREFLFTQRLNRYKLGEYGWRTLLAAWLCRNLLDPFQAGGHCR